MDEKTKKLIVIVFTALISLAVSVAACLLGVPANDLVPDIAASDETCVERSENTAQNSFQVENGTVYGFDEILPYCKAAEVTKQHR